MPLVTRQANQGRLFVQATEPADWLNGDLWVDTDNSNVFVNNSGTAVSIGVGTLGAATEVLTVNAGADEVEWAAGGIATVLQFYCADPVFMDNGQTRFWPLIGSIQAGGVDGTEASNQIPAPLTGTLQNLRFRINVNAINQSTVITIRDAGADTNITVTVAASTTGTFSDLVNTQAVTADDLIGIEGVAAAGAGVMTNGGQTIELVP
ncbi:MAG: hypothetical protein V3U54_13390 [Thermodesulfobacteriota bacterium]